MFLGTGFTFFHLRFSQRYELTYTFKHCTKNKFSVKEFFRLRLRFYITICSCLYSVCLAFSAGLEATFQWLLPNTAYAIRKTILRNLNYVQWLSMALMEKTWLMVVMEYSPNDKDIMVPVEYTPMVNSPNRKNMVLWKALLEGSNGHGKR